MKTAEVAIEHVLAGLLAICAFILPFVPRTHDLKIDNTEIVGVLGLAYMIGVVFDRVAETRVDALDERGVPPPEADLPVVESGVEDVGEVAGAAGDRGAGVGDSRELDRGGSGQHRGGGGQRRAPR